tara:strand:+ start:76329 stop:78485 length:2157 start_codon:yes stop_codon:yes gene_type:complete
MIEISKKCLQDLEFDKIINQILKHAITSLGKSKINDIRPFTSKKRCIENLNLVNEFTSSFENENRIPNHGFEEIIEELKLLKIQNSFLDIVQLIRIKSICLTANNLLVFFKKFQDYYPLIFKISNQIQKNINIPKHINSVINRNSEIRNDASSDLFKIRKSIQYVRTKINTSFNSALSFYNSENLLDEIKESVVDNRRVLAVKAMYRKKIKGNILGASKTGSIVYIEPDTTQNYQRELNNLEFEENEEIKKILLDLTNFIRTYRPLLDKYQEFLILIDVLYSKSKYASEINGILPNICESQNLFLKNVYHPLLLKTNKNEGKITVPQTIKMNPESRIIVISGPNAGGKSITLKTVGLIQIMFQSGLLIPANESSKMSFFDIILTDIGDNQSIENQLSTYSYRLKEMNYFLNKCNNNTLFLIDEFGTGSDPELGGALAEVFLEIFYEKKAFGIITTHYTNLKVLANELPFIKNANMLFDEESLLPTFKLILGQAGSSFTFEVAEKNGIPKNLIKRSKSKIDKGKIRFDSTIASLQKERIRLEKDEKLLRKNRHSIEKDIEKLKQTNLKAEKKLHAFQEMFDDNQKLISLGKKISNLAEKFHNNKRKRELMNEVFKLVQIHNSKKIKLTKKEKNIKLKKDKILSKELELKINKIRKEKNAAKNIKKSSEIKTHNFRIGERVRMDDGRAIGTIDKIEKNIATVNYGLFKTQVSTSRLNFVD